MSFVTGRRGGGRGEGRGAKLRVQITVSLVQLRADRCSELPSLASPWQISLFWTVINGAHFFT